jgi:hypothetical protein
MRYDAIAFLESLFTPVDLTSDHLPGDWHIIWDERAAIMENDGGLPRELAEHFARLEVHKQMACSGDAHKDATRTGLDHKAPGSPPPV